MAMATTSKRICTSTVQGQLNGLPSSALMRLAQILARQAAAEYLSKTSSFDQSPVPPQPSISYL
jgi:hypothetical protein